MVLSVPPLIFVMKPIISTITATHNTPYSTLYTVLSLLKFNPDFQFKIHIIDQGDPNELTESFVRPFCYRYEKDPTLRQTGWSFHGCAISRFCDKWLEDDFFLTLDSDLYSVKEGGFNILYEALISDDRNYAASSHLVSGKYIDPKWNIVSEEKAMAEPYKYYWYTAQSCMWYSLRKNDEDFKRVSEVFRFSTGIQCGIGPVVGGYMVEKTYDTGGFISAGMRLRDRVGIEVPAVRDYILHAGALSTTPGKYAAREEELKEKCLEINPNDLKNYIKSGS